MKKSSHHSRFQLQNCCDLNDDEKQKENSSAVKIKRVLWNLSLQTCARFQAPTGNSTWGLIWRSWIKSSTRFFSSLSDVENVTKKRVVGRISNFSKRVEILSAARGTWREVSFLHCQIIYEKWKRFRLLILRDLLYGVHEFWPSLHTFYYSNSFHIIRFC